MRKGGTKLNVDPVHSVTYKFENEAIFLRFGSPSKNGGVSKCCHFSVGGKHFDNGSFRIQ